MNCDGAWRAVYADVLWGVGIVILRSGKFLGCDGQYFYEGDYSVQGDAYVTAKVHVLHYAGEARSIFHQGEQISLMEYWADLEGGIDGNELRLEGRMTHNDFGFKIIMTRLLPGPLPEKLLDHPNS